MDLPRVLLFNNCSIRVYRSFAALVISVEILLNEFYIFPIMLVLCLMLSVTHYSQNGVSLYVSYH